VSNNYFSLFSINRKFHLVRIDQKNCYDNNNILINSNNTNINSITVVFDSQSKFPFQSKKRHLLNKSSLIQKCFLLLIILSIILAGLVIISFIQFTRLRINYDYIVDEQIKNQEMVQRLENLQSDVNQTFQQLANKVERLNKEQSKMKTFDNIQRVPK
jgi:uncharacterized protein HemX